MARVCWCFVREWLPKFQALESITWYCCSMMKMQSLISEKHRNLISDVLSLAQQKVKRQGKQLSDLRFAKRTKYGYAFFEKTHDMWDVLHETAKEALRKHPEYELAFVVEICSELVNMDESEISSLGYAF